jgi:phosphotransferase system enzyme I (PtsP)
MGEMLQVPVQIVSGLPRIEAALRFAAGATPSGSLAANLSYLCAQLSLLANAPIASVYVLEGKDDLVLRGNHGFNAEALGEVRLKVGEGITGKAVETMRPVTVSDAGLTAQFAYFPQLAEERYPAFLAVPLLAASRPRGALVLQRVAGPFTEEDLLLALLASRTFTALVELEHPQGASSVLNGEGNERGRAVGIARVLSRVMPRREGQKRLDAEGQRAARNELAEAFAAERAELSELIERARAQAKAPTRAFDELATMLDDGRLIERAGEHVSAGLGPSQALERIAAEAARVLASHGAVARRALDVEAFVGGVAHRRAGLEADRVRRGEVMVAVHLSGPAALRGWAQGVTGALCSTDASESSGCAVLTALGLPVVSGLRQLFDWVGNGDRVGLDADKGEAIVNPSAAQAASFRKP